MKHGTIKRRLAKIIQKQSPIVICVHWPDGRRSTAEDGGLCNCEQARAAGRQVEKIVLTWEDDGAGDGAE